MFLTKLKNLTSEFPRETEALLRLNDLIASAEVGRTYFPLAKLYDVSRFSSQYIFTYVIDSLVNDGVFKKILRIETENGGIEDFSDIDEVPNKIKDWRTGEEIVVKPGYIKVLFLLQSKKN